MFNFTLTPEQEEYIKNAYGGGAGPVNPPNTPSPQTPPAPVPVPVGNVPPPPPAQTQVPSPSPQPTLPNPGMMLNPEGIGGSPNFNPSVPPPQPPTPIPATPSFDISEKPTTVPQLPSGGGKPPSSTEGSNPYLKPDEQYANPLDPYYMWEAENNSNLTEESNASIWVSGTGREDEQGLSQMARLDQLNQANEALIPEGKEKGFQSNSLIHLMYGGLLPSESSKNPNYDAGQKGDTVGGVGNTDAWGKDIYWSKPSTGTYGLGDTVQTPGGEYLVVNGAEGNLALMPLKDAATNGNQFLYNMTAGEHHIGINPETGEVWYQQAAGFTNFSGDRWTNPNAPSGSNPDNGGGNNGGGNNGGGDIWAGTTPPDPSDGYTGTGEQPNIFGSPSGRASVVASAMAPTRMSRNSMMGGNPLAVSPMASMDFQGLGYESQRQQPTPPTPAQQNNNDYVTMLNQMMKQSLFRGQ